MRSVTLILISLMGMSPAFAERISDDAGGLIDTYVQKFSRIRDSGERTVVDGQCLSACTLVLAFVPRERMCVTPNAVFGSFRVVIRCAEARRWIKPPDPCGTCRARSAVDRANGAFIRADLSPRPAACCLLSDLFSRFDRAAARRRPRRRRQVRMPDARHASSAMRATLRRACGSERVFRVQRVAAVTSGRFRATVGGIGTSNAL